MKIYATRDYGSDFSTGIYHNIGEDVTFRYLSFQIRGIGQIQLLWTRN